jgi:hypothetical protein
MGIGSGLKSDLVKQFIKTRGVLKETAATAKPAMRYAPLDLSDTGRPSLNLKNKEALKQNLQLNQQLQLHRPCATHHLI